MKSLTDESKVRATLEFLLLSPSNDEISVGDYCVCVTLGEYHFNKKLQILSVELNAQS